MDKKYYLLKKIESCRKDMITLTMTEDLCSDAVVNASTRLDHLLNEYERILSKV